MAGPSFFETFRTDVSQSARSGDIVTLGENGEEVYACR